MPNQFTKAEDEGLEKPPGANQFTKGTRLEHPEDVRAKIKTSNIIARLEKITEESDNEQAIIAASKTLLDKALPSLSSVEQTVVNDVDSMDEDTLFAMLKGIVMANPALLSRLLDDVGQPKVGDPGLRAVS